MEHRVRFFLGSLALVVGAAALAIACGGGEFQVGAAVSVTEGDGAATSDAPVTTATTPGAVDAGPGVKPVDAAVEAGCVPESNGDLCSRVAAGCGPLTARDRCGKQRTITSCGNCPTPAVCGAIQPNRCDCPSESDAAFCTRLGSNCGALSATDNCGKARTVASCGACTGGKMCTAKGACVGGNGASCAGMGADTNGCGTAGCCDNLPVAGGTFPMGRTETASSTDKCPLSTTSGSCLATELPPHAVTMSDFRLDTFEVTVGRFRTFVSAFNGTPPAEGSGTHPLVRGSGWQAVWNKDLASTQAALLANVKCSPGTQTWTDAPGPNENKAINCVSWLEAFVFCAWDGGRLPTEAEWEYAAAGGGEDRLYPWGSSPPACNATNFAGCGGQVVDVGTKTGYGRWGQRDLGGNVWEWTLDWDARYTSAPATNPANVAFGDFRLYRGGSFGTDASSVRAAYRLSASPTDRNAGVGIRCAHSQ